MKIDSLQPITREQAEHFFEHFEVLNTQVEQSEKELRVIFNLSDKRSVMVIYNNRDHKESFFTAF
jgi:hypothetical protein